MNKQINSGYFFVLLHILQLQKEKKKPHVACVLNYILMFASTEMCIIRLLLGTFFDLYAER